MGLTRGGDRGSLTFPARIAAVGRTNPMERRGAHAVAINRRLVPSEPCDSPGRDGNSNLVRSTGHAGRTHMTCSSSDGGFPASGPMPWVNLPDFRASARLDLQFGTTANLCVLANFHSLV